MTTATRMTETDKMTIEIKLTRKVNDKVIVDAVGEGVNNQWIGYLAFGDNYVPPPSIGKGYGYIF